jgi:hypothetical protein
VRLYQASIEELEREADRLLRARAQFGPPPHDLYRVREIVRELAERAKERS